MKKLRWKLRSSKLDLSLSGFPECFVLVPETSDERTELIDALEDQGVLDNMGFVKNGISGRLDFPHDPQWKSDGALELTITIKKGEQLAAWFWLIEIDDGSARRFAWWGTDPNRDRAIPWA